MQGNKISHIYVLNSRAYITIYIFLLLNQIQRPARLFFKRNLNYCNPPFNEAGKWVKKAFQEKQRGRTTALLIPARTETAYFQDYILNQWFDGVFVKFLKKGYGFLNPDTFEPMGVYKNALAIVVMRGNKEN